MKNFVVKLVPLDNETDEYERNDSNMACITIQLPNGKIVDKQGYKVMLNLSKDAMIGLGTSLIRKAHRSKSEYGFWHLYPLERDSPTENLGIYLHPDSHELLISEVEFGEIQDFLEDIQ